MAMTGLNELKESFLHLLFPHICEGCGNDRVSRESMLCMRCLEALPETNFELHSGNPVERKFYGRLPLIAAAARYYFSKESLMQHLVHQVKYKGNKELGWQLGRMMGAALKSSCRFNAAAMIPLPLFRAKERKRGYNQSMILCEGIAECLSVPILQEVIIRPRHTETQTKKGRIGRWSNMEGKFILTDPEAIAGKHILLVDDIITTGATLEACGTELLKAGNIELSIACLCYAARG